MPKILHLFEQLKNTNNSRSIIAAAKWSTRLHEYDHSFAVLGTADPQALYWAQEAGIEVLVKPNQQMLDARMAAADIIQVEYMNTPAINNLLRQNLPQTRLVLWCHVQGNSSPQVLPDAVAQMADVCIAGSAITQRMLLSNTSLQSSPPERFAMIIPPADFSSLTDLERKPHMGFNVGYIGETDLINIHPEFMSMGAMLHIPDAMLMVHGNADNQSLQQQQEAWHLPGRFKFTESQAEIMGMMETMDVFGCPLNPQMRSTALPYLQEAMWAGIPPVVMDHGFAGGIIKHNETGLIAQNQEDYVRTIEFLYNNPIERERIGLNASIFARTHLGAKNTAFEFNKVYGFLQTLPKRNHAWGYSPYEQMELVIPASLPSNAKLFVDALGIQGLAFEISLSHPEVSQQIAAEKSIAGMSTEAFNSIQRYVSFGPEDPHLRLWAGLYLEQQMDPSDAVVEFASAIEQGLNKWRIQWYLARALFKAGKTEESKRIYAGLRQSTPNFDALTGDTQFADHTPQPIELSIPAQPAVDHSLSSDSSIDLGILPMAARQPMTLDIPVSDTPFADNTVDATLASNAPKLNSDVSQIRVSAIVSTYASEAFIDGCLHDLVSQSLFQKNELEIIVIDAHSPENEQEIVERYQANFENIKYVRTPEREPLYVSWNRGIKMAKGTYITSANTDDRHRKDALEVLADYLDSHPEFALLYAGQIDTSVPNESFETTSSSKILNWPNYTYAELERHCIIGSQPMWRASLHDKYGYFREDLISAGDYEFWLRIGKHEPFFRYPDTLGLYFRNPEGIEHGSQVSSEEALQIWQEYGMFERGIPVILKGRVITKAHVPQFTAPVDTSAKPRPSFDFYVNEFESALQQQDYDQALMVAESSIQDYSELPYPLILKAIVLRLKQQFTAALESLEKSFKFDETPEALVELVQLSIATGQEDEARRTSEYIFDRYPEWQQRIQGLTSTLIKDDTAPPSGPAKLDDLDYSLSTFPELKSQFEQLLHVKEVGRAEKLAKAAIQNFPNNHESWVLKATSDRLKGSFHEAREAIHKSLLIEDSPEALIELFQVSQALGDDEEANNIAMMFDVAYPDFSSRFRELFPDAVS